MTEAPGLAFHIANFIHLYGIDILVVVGFSTAAGWFIAEKF